MLENFILNDCERRKTVFYVRTNIRMNRIELISNKKMDRPWFRYLASSSIHATKDYSRKNASRFYSQLMLIAPTKFNKLIFLYFYIVLLMFIVIVICW